MDNDKVTEVLQHLIGTAYEPSVKATITELTGRLRVLGPADVSTFEYDPRRVSILTDADALIKGFAFG